jgi:hypothetical protein
MDGNGRRWMAVLVGASTFFALAGVATARLTSESGSVTIAPQQNGTATAKCGSGSAAVAGGFAAPGFDPTADTGPANITFASSMSGKRKWQASGHNFHNPAPSPKVDTGSGPLVAYAYCDKHDPSVTVRSKSMMVDSLAHASVTPKCRRGSEAVSGGFQQDAPGSEGFINLAYTSKRSGDRGWKVSVINPDSVAHSVTAFAYCEKHGPDLVTRAASDDFQPIGALKIAAKCPSGAKVFSGGYRSSFNQSGNELSFGVPYTSKRSSGEKWKVSALRAVLNGTGTRTTETAIVYCAA